MLRKAMVAAAAAASVVGMAVAAAPSALAIGNDNGPAVTNGTGATSSFGNSAANANLSPQLSPVQGTMRDSALSRALEKLSGLSANGEQG
ncbi:hypothetical protein [Streptomyces sp. NPDC096152]|uniref:hypothetical protein n=1 Tax=Streptomyces sp. NPDC096152 TaxID=3366078 RepID=UPI0038138935